MRLTLSGVFSILMHGLKNAVLRIDCSISAPGRDYGQKADF